MVCPNFITSKMFEKCFSALGDTLYDVLQFRLYFKSLLKIVVSHAMIALQILVTAVLMWSLAEQNRFFPLYTFTLVPIG